MYNSKLTFTILTLSLILLIPAASLPPADAAVDTWSEKSIYPYSLSSVHFTDESNGWAVGSDGIILHTTNGGDTWSDPINVNDKFSNPLNYNLSDVFFVNEKNSWFVGDSGWIVHYDGDATWSQEFVGTSNLNSVFFTNENNGWAVADNGAALYYNGTDWNSKEVGVDILESVSFVNATHGWAVGGDFGFVYSTTNGGDTWIWELVAPTHRGGFHSVFFTDVNNGWVVGAGGAVLHYNGTDWNRKDVGNSNLNSVHFVDKDNGWAVGDNGTILHYNDSIWTSETVGTNHLNSVFFTDENNGWAVGGRGTLLTGTDTTPPIPTISIDDTFNYYNGISPFVLPATIEFSEPVTGFNATTVISDPNDTKIVQFYPLDSDGKSYSVNIMVESQNVIRDFDYSFSVPAGKVQDAAGNYNTASNTVTIRVDNVPPTVTSFTSKLNPATDKNDITVKFSEELSSFNATHITTVPASATITEPVKLSPTLNEYKFTLTPKPTIANPIEIKINAVTDRAGNSLSGVTSITLDSKPPTVTITSPTQSPTSGDIEFIVDLEVAEYSKPGENTSTVRAINGNIITGNTFNSTRTSWIVHPTINEGPVTFYAEYDYIRDPVGGTSSVKTELTVMFDKIPPTFTVDSNSVNYTLDYATTVVQGGSYTAGVISNIVDASAHDDGVVAGDAVIVDTAGTYIVTYTVTDAAGNSAKITEIVTVSDTTTTTTVPAPSTPDLHPSSDSIPSPVGPYSTDNITNDNTPTINGTGIFDNAVTLYSNGTEIAPITLSIPKVSADDTWSITTSTLADGVHLITATQTSPAGETSPASEPLSITIDTTLPTVTSESKLVNGKVVFTVTFDVKIFTFFDGLTHQPLVENGSIGSLGVTSIDHFVFDVTVTPTDSTKPVTITVKENTGIDIAGNGNVVKSFTFTPATVPAPSTPDLNYFADSGILDTDNITNDTALMINGTGISGNAVTLHFNSTAITPTQIVSDDNLWIFIINSLGEGVHSITATQTSPAGDISPASEPLSIIIDKTLPTFTVNGNRNNYATPVLLDGTYTVGVIDNIVDTSGTDGGIVGGDTVDVSTDGKYNVTYTVTDKAGNSAKIRETVAVRDASLGTPDLDPPSDSGMLNTDDITNDNTPTIIVNGIFGNAVTLYSNGTALDTTKLVQMYNRWLITPTTELADGVHSITATQTFGGETSPASEPLVITIDKTAPRVAHTAPDDGTTLKSNPVLTWNAVDDVGLADKPYDLDISNTPTFVSTVGSVRYHSATSYDINWLTSGTLPEGTYYWKVIVTDKAGNTAESTPTRFTIDKTAPTLPDAPTSLNATAGINQVSLEWTAPANNGGKSITDYKIEYTPTGGVIKTFVDGVSTSTSTIVTPLDGGVQYQFRVSAINSDGVASLPSNTATATADIDPNLISPILDIIPTISTIPNPTTSNPIPITVTFPVPVSNFNATGVSVTGGTMNDDFVNSNDKKYTFSIVPTSTSVLVEIAANAAFDGEGNGNVAASLDIQYISKKGGSDDNAHKTRPTFGLDHNTGRQLIEGGFSFNGVSHDITDNFWTPFAEQEVLVGDTNIFTIKTYADKQLHIQEFLFGIPEVGEAHNAELGVEVFFGYDGKVENINVVQKTDVIDVESVEVITFDSKCTADDDTEKCNTTQLSMKFLEPLKDKVMALKAIDFKNRYLITYLNDGFDVTGESLNPMIVTSIPGTEKYESLITITQNAKYSDMWTSEDGRTFESNEYGTFKWTNETYERTPDTGAIKNRLHSEFAGYKDTVTQKAIIELLELCPTCLDSYTDFDDSWTYELPETYDFKTDDPVIQQKLIDESKRAQEIMNYLLDPISASR